MYSLLTLKNFQKCQSIMAAHDLSKIIGFYFLLFYFFNGYLVLLIGGRGRVDLIYTL